jgi:enoyl-CoA hydratase
MMEQAELLVSRHGRVGRIRLNRPRALNSLTLGMVRGFAQALTTFSTDPEIIAVLVTGEGDRGLCAGGDIRALYNLRDGDKDYYRVFWREEYELNALIAAFSKPYVVVMDGLVMGGGVGVSAHGNCRIVTDRTRLAMPETSIGFIPDVGGTFLLARAGGPGVYMALSGQPIGGADALEAGLADWAVESHRIPALIEKLEAVESALDVRETLQNFTGTLRAGELALHRDLLDRTMTGGSIETVLGGLQAESSIFARRVVSEIAKNSPTSLKITHALLNEARHEDASLEICLLREYRAACKLLESHDLYEGIRAAIVDKDRAPKWRPDTLSAVSAAAVTEILRGDGSAEPCFSRHR